MNIFLISYVRTYFKILALYLNQLSPDEHQQSHSKTDFTAGAYYSPENGILVI